MNKTFSLKAADIKRDWFLFDAEGIILGRLAAQIATLLRGKHKPTFQPNLDCGDSIVVINADKVVLTGNKESNKIYYRHTGYPGGIRSKTADKLRATKPEDLLLKAVRNMLPGNALGHLQLKHLYVYNGTEHKHEAQSPKKVDFAAANRHNSITSA
jgi:large subunit ribosomal protein L13